QHGCLLLIVISLSSIRPVLKLSALNHTVSSQLEGKHMTHSIVGQSQQRMPVLFIPHGAGPCFFMDWQPADTWNVLGAFLRGVGETLPARPKAIVLVSAHWLDDRFAVTGHSHPELVYDYYGFPPHTYELAYPAPGHPALAERTRELLSTAGLPSGLDPQRGFDHGMFI